MALLTAVALCLLLLPCFTVPARAASNPGTYTFDISEGNITVQPGTNSGTFKVCYGNPQVALDNIDPAQPITIIGSSDTGNRIMVNIGAADDKAVYITINGINISTSSVCPFSIGTDSTVHLTLSGTNILWSTASAYNFFKGLDLPTGAVLDITSNSTGSLSVTGSGSYDGGHQTGCVGIGGGGTVTIRGGTVTATGGQGHTGINCSTVMIRGGTVTAIGGKGGGTGIDGTVTISGGTVTVKGGTGDLNGGGAGISGTVTINGGSVTASGGDTSSITGNAGGVGISGIVEINGGTVAAAGGISNVSEGVSGIDGTVTINGGIVSATGGQAGNALGNGDGISGIVRISGSMVTATGGVGSKRGRAGIRGTVTISGSTVVASGSDACLGSETTGGTGIDGDNVTISNSTVIATGGRVLFGTAGDGIKGSTVMISDSAVTATGGNGGSGNGGSGTDGSGINGSTVIINNGSVKVSSIGTAVYNSNNDEVYLAVISGLPKSSAVSFTVNMASPTSYPTDTDGRLYLWLPQGSLTFRAVVGDIEYSASGEIAANNNNCFMTNYVHALSMVCNYMITTTGNSGSAASPYLAAIKVPNSHAALTKADLTIISDFTADLFSDGSFTTTTGSISLPVDVSTTVYIRVTAQDEATSLYYSVNVTRESNDDIVYTFDISKGNIAVQPGTSPGTLQVCYGASQILDNIAPSQHIYINSASATSNTIAVNGSVTVCVTLNGVNISSSTCPLSISSGSAVHLTLSGTNTLSTSGWYSAGLSVPQGAILDITSDSTGSLTATSSSYGAGIGGSGAINSPDGYGGDCGTITIGGGTITARSNGYGAAIGGGGAYHGGNGGAVTINGGTVTATGDGFASGIGGGSGNYGGNGGVLTVNGGIVTATGGIYGSGIGGGGSNSYSGGNGGAVTVSGGMVTATGGICGSGIGGGASIYSAGGIGGTVIVNGGTVVATGGTSPFSSCLSGDGIGRGGGAAYGANCGMVTVNSGSVNASNIGATVSNSSGTQEYLVTVTDLPVNTGVSYTIDGGNTAFCTVDAGGKLYLWLPQTGIALDIRIACMDNTVYHASGTVQASGNNIFPSIKEEATGAGTISGTVTNGINPIAGAAVNLAGNNIVFSITTEADGSYSIQNVPSGSGYTVIASKSGYTMGSVSNVSVAADTTTSGVDIILTSDEEGCLMTYKGAQKRYNAGSDTYDIRFIAAIDTLGAEEVGFVFSKSQPIPTRENATVKATTTVYTTITAAGSTITAESLGGTYISVCTVTGIPASDITVPLYVRAFSTAGAVTKYTPTVTITVSNLP